MLFHWLSNKNDFTKVVDRFAPAARKIEEYLSSQNSITGWCSACQKITTMTIHKPADGGWCDLRESIVCACGLNGRMRAIINALDETISIQDRFLMMERVTPLFHKVKDRYPTVEGCEFLGLELPSGSIRMVNGIGVRHEDLMNLSYEDETFDILFHGDVLEHVPNHLMALQECYRVLKPGGVMLFTCPFFNFEEHLVRCMVNNHLLHHILPPAYHGNPVSTQGSLVFIHHGWPLLEEISRVGFASTEIGLFYDPFQGIVSNNNSYPEGHMWPVVFRAIK